MMQFLTVAQHVVILFVLMGFGAVCRKTRLVSEAGIGALVNLLLLIVTPCLIVDVFQRPFEPAMLRGLGLALAIAIAGHAVAIALAYLLVRHRDVATRQPLRLSAVFSNAGFMGLPLEHALLGEEGVFYGVVYVVVFNLFMWSWGLRLMSRDSTDSAGGAMKMIVNPGTVGIALGLPLFLCSVHLPPVIGTPVHLMSELNTPLAMIVIGHSLVGARLGKVACMPSAYVATIVRLVVYPLCMMAALYPFRQVLDRNMALALVIAASAPVAAMVSMFAAKFKRDVDTSVAVVSGSTLLSVLTMPLLITLAMRIWP